VARYYAAAGKFGKIRKSSPWRRLAAFRAVCGAFAQALESGPALNFISIYQSLKEQSGISEKPHLPNEK
jgi:hypothetical protein